MIGLTGITTFFELYVVIPNFGLYKFVYSCIFHMEKQMKFLNFYNEVVQPVVLLLHV